MTVRSEPVDPVRAAVDLRGMGVLRDKRWILRDVTCTIPAGACAAVIGPNGSGKSTLARIAAGYLWPTVGQVNVLGEQYGEADLPHLKRRIRLVQPSSISEPEPEASTEDAVVTGFFGTAWLYDMPTSAMRHQAREALAQVGLQQVAAHPYLTLSTGERMRCLIARALVVRPELLILDEPTAGLDLVAREQTLRSIENLAGSGITIVLITHHVEEIPRATTDIILLSNGTVARQGPPDRVLQSDAMTHAYGWPIQVDYVNGRYFATTRS